MRMTSGVLGPAAAAAALWIGSAGLAQDGAPAAGTSVSSAAPVETQGATPNPHALLGELNGGPDGSPTAQRGNPRPGTSTSIPTAHPATVQPLEHRAGDEDVAIEDTGIQGQCDPVVSIGCPAVADRLQPEEAVESGAAPDTATANQPDPDAGNDAADSAN